LSHEHEVGVKWNTTRGWRPSQRLHARIAQVLEERPTEAGEAGPEVLAQHLTNAGLAARAIPYWRRAGELAARRSANLEAVAHLSKGLELVGTLPDEPKYLDEELALRIAIGGPLMATRGYPVPEVERTYSRAWALCDQLGRSAELFPVLRGLWNYHLLRGELRQAHDLAQRLVVLAKEQGTPVHRALARRARGTAFVFPRPVRRFMPTSTRNRAGQRPPEPLGTLVEPRLPTSTGGE